MLEFPFNFVVFERYPHSRKFKLWIIKKFGQIKVIVVDCSVVIFLQDEIPVQHIRALTEQKNDQICNGSGCT
ncbi:hypothetical protein SAMN05216302_102923 [Nitrosomonas aestuarii]|uniref:Uncharacterized protein n=1 Tax=Nitrosomonas aestuarii TaxID=52441 RepID=A0A1I4EL92_9PROT|nr:hypothetical protein SAMN05216302_102923 [Nitrosomonas aestuarii]